MDPRNDSLKRFERRVRLVRSWKGLAIGASFGSLAAAVWAGLDLANVATAEWSSLGAVVGGGTLLGMLVGLFSRIPKNALADSIDRRASLDERLTTSIERSAFHSGFDEALHADAQSHLDGLKPAKLYPVQVGRWQGAALVLAALASGIFLLGNTQVLLNDQQKKDKDELKKAGQIVEHVAKPVEDDMKTPSQNEDEKRLAEALRKLSKDLEKAKISKEEAMQKTNEVQKQAEQLVKDRATQTQQSIAKAESAFEKLQKEEMSKSMGKADPSDSKMTDAERQSKADQLQKESDNVTKQISKLQDQMTQQGKDGAMQMKLDKELQDLLKQQNKLAQELQELKLSKNVQDMYKRMMENPLFKKLLEMQKKLQDAMKDAQQNGQQTKLTHEQIEEMRKELEEMAKKLKDDKAMSEYLQALMDAMKNACGT